jgi:hypothetical protein
LNALEASRGRSPREAEAKQSTRGVTSAVFVYGFAKNERDNISPDELKFWRRIATAFLATAEAQLAAR